MYRHCMIYWHMSDLIIYYRMNDPYHSEFEALIISSDHRDSHV